jgi:NTE family protein
MIDPHSAGATAPEPAKPTGTPFQSVVLLLQGGGALGAYQGGVYEAFAECGIEPTWIAGISIGAINSAIIAGNPPAERVAKLRAFWELVSAGSAPAPWGFWGDLWSGGVARAVANQVAAGDVVINGVPGFFTPRYPPAPMQAPGTAAATSCTTPSPCAGRWSGWSISTASTPARCVSASAP